METHPYPLGFIPKSAKTLIMGTFPPEKHYLQSSESFFYPSPQNHFWNRMENIFPTETLKRTSTKLQSISLADNTEAKKDFARRKKIGFLDVFTRVARRTPGSSKDSDLLPLENVLRNGVLYSTLHQHAEITRICCTYKLAFQTLISNLSLSELQTKSNEFSANKLEIVWQYNEKGISIFLLFAATRSGEKTQIKDDQYAHLIFQ